MTGLYSVSQNRQFEHMVFANGVKPVQLVERAAAASFRFIEDLWPGCTRVHLLVGKGGNGADGWELARLLHLAGYAVHVYSVFSPDADTELVRTVRDSAVQAGVASNLFSPGFAFPKTDLWVDALLGIGVHSEIKGLLREAVDYLNAQEFPILSLDIPSGFCGNSGSIHGAAVKATATLSFVSLKKGLMTGKAVSYRGQLKLDTLGIPDSILTSINPAVSTLTADTIASLLPTRCRNAHKGDFGHVLLVGGDYGMGGAIRLAAEAALRVGAGLVSVATRPEHVNIVNGGRPELMCYQIREVKDIESLLARATVIVLGPGLGQTDWSCELFNRVLDSPLPKVMDADALNLLSRMPEQANNWVLTPHPGEAARLLDTSSGVIQQTRYQSTKQLQERYGGVCLLKGAGTIVVSEEKDTFLCPAGNPGMASAGMGDLLSGAIGGLISQKLSLLDATKVGTVLHSMAADRAAEVSGGERGLLATDVLSHLKEFLNPNN